MLRRGLLCILLLLLLVKATLKSPPHTSSAFDMDKLGKLLATARASNVRSTAITLDQVSHLTSQQGYAVLHHTTESLQTDHGWKIAGWKVGATSLAVQQRIGLSEPFWGPIFSKTTLTGGQRGEASRFSIQKDLIRGIEAEFAFQIKRDIVPRAEPYSVQELMHEYCSTVTPCVEVCASRMQADVQSNTPMLIGDTGNFTVIFPTAHQHDMPASKVYEELKHCKTSCNLDGKQVAAGSGADVLGSPELSLQWFANNVVNGERQLTIQAGEFVTTGATCGLIPITKPCYARVYFSGVSNCEFDLAFRE